MLLIGTAEALAARKATMKAWVYMLVDVFDDRLSVEYASRND